MLLRKITSALLQWKNKEKKKCLLVQGARQVGKTFSIHAFGKISYKEVLEINLKESRQDQLIFSGNLDVDTLIQAIRFRYPHLKLTGGDTDFPGRNTGVSGGHHLSEILDAGWKI